MIAIRVQCDTFAQDITLIGLIVDVVTKKIITAVAGTDLILLLTANYVFWVWKLVMRVCALKEHDVSIEDGTNNKFLSC